MAKTFKAILIDPELCRIEMIDFSGETDEIPRIISSKDGADYFPIASHAEFPRRCDYGWVDEFGLSRGEPIFAFRLRILPDPLAGKCLVTGMTSESYCDVMTPIDFFRGEVQWIGKIKPEVTVDTNGNHIRSIVNYSRVN